MKKKLFLLVFLVSTAAHADDKKICIFVTAKKLASYERVNYTLETFFCKEHHVERFDENGEKERGKVISLEDKKDNNYKIKYLKNSKVIKEIKFSFVQNSIDFAVKQYPPDSVISAPTKKELEQDRIRKRKESYNYERRFLIKDLLLADEVQVFKEKKLVISDKINFKDPE